VNVVHELCEAKLSMICAVSDVLYVAMQAFRLHKVLAEAARAWIQIEAVTLHSGALRTCEVLFTKFETLPNPF